MSRQLFGTWGVDLSDDDFACALAALGIAYHQYGLFASSFEPITTALQRAMTSSGPVLWDLNDFLETPVPSYLSALLRQVDANDAAAAWKNERIQHDLIRIAIRHAYFNMQIAPWIVGTLSRPAVEAASVFILDDGLNPPLRWRLPMRVAVIEDGASPGFLGNLQANQMYPQLVRFVSEGPVDFLILAGSPRRAALDLLQLAGPPRANCVFVLGPLRDPWPNVLLHKATLAQEARAAGICLGHVPAALRTEWFNNLIREFGHNNPLDIAVARAYTVLSVSAVPGRAQPLFTVSNDLLQTALASETARQLGRELRTWSLPTSIDLPGTLPGRTGLPNAENNPREVGEALERTADEMAFEHEGDEASDIAELTTAVECSMRSATPPVKESRFIQANVFDMGAVAAPTQLTNALRSGGRHAVNVRVGPADESWITPPPDQPFPDLILPPRVGDYRLQVVFSEPNHAPTPQVAAVLLPPEGPSTECQFYFTALSQFPEFEGRIVVLYENRVVQTALLKADSQADPWVPSNRPISIEIETIVRPDLAELEGRSRFQAAIVINQNNDGIHRALGVADGYSLLFSLEGVDEALKNIRKKLSSVVQAPDDFSHLRTDKTEELLLYLAYQGRSLYEVFQDKDHDSPLLEPRTPIQIVSTKNSSLLPLEYVYEFTPPKPDAKLCPKAEKALEDGECADCPYREEDPCPYVCPLGFWCMSRVIERHTHDETADEPLGPSEFRLRAEPYRQRALTPLASAAYAASNKVDAADPAAHEIEQVFNSLTATVSQGAVRAVTWEEWEQRVQEQRPSLILILPHTLKQFDLPAMEIGVDAQLNRENIKDTHLGVSPTHPPPVVILLGCNTQAIDIPFQGLVPQFRRKGAAIVMSTLTPVLGRHAGPVARRVVENLSAICSEGGKSFGEVMLKLRMSALADGYPMVLCLFADGDADWILEPAVP